MMGRKHILVAGAVGNVIEWYDFGLYGLLAPVLASSFFPSHDRIASLLAVYGGFAVGFAMRPIGAVVLGRIGDRRGRQFVLVLSVVLMGGATVLLGLLPTYQSVGIWAAVLLIVVRLVQGFSVGGEFVGSVTYLVETAEPNRRGIAGSVANVGATIGMLLGAGAAALAQRHPGQMWRLPFLFGGLLAFIGYLLRRHLPPENFDLQLEAERKGDADRVSSRGGLFDRWPALQAFRAAPRTMLIATLFTCGYGVANYLTMVFLPTFGHEFANIRQDTALWINSAGQGLVLLVIPLAGWISDAWMRRRTVLAIAFLMQAVLSWVLFRFVLQAGTTGLWTAQLVLAALLALVMGTAPAMLSEQFPRHFRVSAHAFVLNIGIGIAGGTAPIVALTLIRGTRNSMAAAAYLILACMAAGSSALLLRDTSRDSMGLSVDSVPLEEQRTA